MKKPLVLTGLAHETDFTQSTEGSFYLVFNRGELRIPVSTAGAELAMKHFLTGVPSVPETDARPMTQEEIDEINNSGSDTTGESSDEEPAPAGEVDEDGVPQV